MNSDYIIWLKCNAWFIYIDHISCLIPNFKPFIHFCRNMAWIIEKEDTNSWYSSLSLSSSGNKVLSHSLTFHCVWNNSQWILLFCISLTCYCFNLDYFLQGCIVSWITWEVVTGFFIQRMVLPLTYFYIKGLLFSFGSNIPFHDAVEIGNLMQRWKYSTCCYCYKE